MAAHSLCNGLIFLLQSSTYVAREKLAHPNERFTITICEPRIKKCPILGRLKPLNY